MESTSDKILRLQRQIAAGDDSVAEELHWNLVRLETQDTEPRIPATVMWVISEIFGRHPGREDKFISYFKEVQAINSFRFRPWYRCSGLCDRPGYWGFVCDGCRRKKRFAEAVKNLKKARD